MNSSTMRDNATGSAHERLNTARQAYDDALPAAASGDLKARAQLSQLRRAIEDLERELAVQTDVDAEAARRNQHAAAAEERARRRAGLNGVEATWTEQVALAKHADALFDEIDTTLRKLEALGTRVVEQFRAHCREPRLENAFCGIGFQHRGLVDDLLRKLWTIPAIAEVLRVHGCGSVTIIGTPSIEETVRGMQRRAITIVDQARAAVAEPELPPAA